MFTMGEHGVLLRWNGQRRLQVALQGILSFWLGSFFTPPICNPALKIADTEKSVCPPHLQKASEKCYGGNMPKKKPSPKWRSGCPLNASVEILGDRWSLLIIRDMMLRGFRTYKEFLDSYEGIATNILADRLRRLIAHGIIATQPDPSDGRKLFYLLTDKGLDLAPILTEMVLWAAEHEDIDNQALVRQILKDKKHFLASVRERWAGKTLPSS
jgi:DNA-binding HxlR family transcriptional regulator